MHINLDDFAEVTPAANKGAEHPVNTTILLKTSLLSEHILWTDEHFHSNTINTRTERYQDDPVKASGIRSDLLFKRLQARITAAVLAGAETSVITFSIRSESSRGLLEQILYAYPFKPHGSLAPLFIIDDHPPEKPA